MNSKIKPAEKSKPFMTGSPIDENTFRQALKFFGALVLVAVMSFIVCSMTSFNSVLLRVGINIVIEALILYIFFNKGASLGTESVARGEIVYQHVQKELEISPNEKKIPFNQMKGFVIGLLGSVLFIAAACILALTAQKQMTGAGTLPSWIDGYMHRSEIRDALVSYTLSTPISLTDIIRIFVRLMIMPFISMCGAENRNLLLIMERISPLLVMLPAAAYGTGYLQGPGLRRKIHTEIAANARKRKIREKRERKIRKSYTPKGPQQLN